MIEGNRKLGRMPAPTDEQLGKVWAGADPGGKKSFGVAVVTESGRARYKTVSSVDEAAKWIGKQGTPLGIGIDAPMWWSSIEGGGRLADAAIRRKYGIQSGTVQSVNSLRGAVVAGGPLLALRLRESFPELPITESHPKALLHALGFDGETFAKRYKIQDMWNDEHQRDAAIAAVCAREGFQGKWKTNLADSRNPSEQDPRSYWLAPVSYFWPKRIC